MPWQYTEQHKTLTEALETPTLTGEDIYLLEYFKPLIDVHAVDIIHPDLASSGGLLETKRIGDYAEEKGIAMAMHQAGTPVSFMANVHCAAATQNFLALEHHSVDLPWWESLVKMTDGKKMIEKGFAPVPLSPGLGIELVDEVVKQHLDPRDTTYVAPTKEWLRSTLLRSYLDAESAHTKEQEKVLHRMYRSDILLSEDIPRAFFVSDRENIATKALARYTASLSTS